MEANGFPAWFARQLDVKQWSAADFARESGFSPGMVSNWLRGRRVPKPASVDKIADVLGADVSVVMTLAGHLPPIEPIDPDDPIERVVAKLRRARLDPLWLQAVEAQIDVFLEHRRAERRAARGQS